MTAPTPPLSPAARLARYDRWIDDAERRVMDWLAARELTAETEDEELRALGTAITLLKRIIEIRRTLDLWREHAETEDEAETENDKRILELLRRVERDRETQSPEEDLPD